MNTRVAFPQPDPLLFAFLPYGMEVGEFRCAVKNRAELEAVQRANVSRLGCSTGPIVEVTRDDRPSLELRLTQANGLVVVFTLAL